MTDNQYSVCVPTLDHWRKMIKCQTACPVNTDARAYVTAIARGELGEGYRIARAMPTRSPLFAGESAARRARLPVVGV
ncbi:MAG: hypothetical protein A3K19_20860 [Lentisphaerae bacterium RIFOXYB12_FULL_65_16]|nr:MAG: hypothetical protein A3K18_19285 [Lentisphaerae bacterium RIFOXYA12_64_32]OGV85186.1 MAG: hypothetical protein A3K19_20860 [Lentisphaerae bacterium RIFOXYB12_FULL_65_16]